MHINIPVFCTYFEKDSPLMIPFPCLLKYSTIIPVYMPLCAYSHSRFCNVRHSVRPNSPPLHLLLCKSVGKLLPLCALRCNSTPPFYITTSFNPFCLWRCLRSGPQLNATADRAEILDAGAQRGAMAEGGPRKSCRDGEDSCL